MRFDVLFCRHFALVAIFGASTLYFKLCFKADPAQVCIICKHFVYYSLNWFLFMFFVLYFIYLKFYFLFSVRRSPLSTCGCSRLFVIFRNHVCSCNMSMQLPNNEDQQSLAAIGSSANGTRRQHQTHHDVHYQKIIWH